MRLMNLVLSTLRKVNDLNSHKTSCYRYTYDIHWKAEFVIYRSYVRDLLLSICDIASRKLTKYFI